MAILATGSKTIIDLSDGQSLSLYLGSNLSRMQVKNSSADPVVFSPDWSVNNLFITPVVYLNQNQIALDDTKLSISWQRKTGCFGT